MKYVLNLFLFELLFNTYSPPSLSSPLPLFLSQKALLHWFIMLMINQIEALGAQVCLWFSLHGS